MVVNTSKILASKNISDFCYFFSDPEKKITPQDISKMGTLEKMTHAIPNQRRIPSKYLSSLNYLVFTLKNIGDSVESFCLSPANYLQVFEIYKETNGVLTGNTLYTNAKPAAKVLNHGYKLIQLAPGEQSKFIIKFKYVKTSVINILPRLVRLEYSLTQVNYDKETSSETSIITFIVSGFFLMMIFYSFASYRQAYRPEFLYYGAYTFCISILLFLKSVLLNNSTAFNFFFEAYLDFFIQLGSVFLYLLFIRSYLNTKVNYPVIEKLLFYSQWIVMGAFAIYTYVYFGTDSLYVQNKIELYTKLFLVALGITFILIGFRYKDTLLKYLVYGNINLIFFGLLSLFFMSTPYHIKNLHWIFSNSFFYYSLSVLGECLLFMVGLSYKNRKELIEKVKMEETLKREHQRQEMEKQLVIINTQQDERNRISADMHDELGAGMTAIRLMSEMAKTKTKDNPVPEIEKISDSSNDLLNKMNAIIWSMNSSNDTLPNLVSYIRSYAITFFENSDSKCLVNVLDEVPEKELSGEKRRNIFLTVKEALNNVVKHSKATEVKIDFTFDNLFCIKITDNGVGINKNKLREFGNGLKNMQKRMERIGGQFEIENNQGTILKLCIPY